MNNKETLLQLYSKWLMEVWNPNQLYIPFPNDAPKAFLREIKEETDLSKLKNTFDELGIKYHELQEGEYTYIQKFGAHDQKGYLGVMGGICPLTKSEQLNNFLEFHNGKLVSW